MSLIPVDGSTVYDINDEFKVRKKMSLLVQFIHLNTLGSKENRCMIEFYHSLNRLLGMLNVGIFLHFKQLGQIFTPILRRLGE